MAPVSLSTLTRWWLAAMVVAAGVMTYGLATPGAPARPVHVAKVATLPSSARVVYRAQVWRYTVRSTHKSAPTV